MTLDEFQKVKHGMKITGGSAADVCRDLGLKVQHYYKRNSSLNKKKTNSTNSDRMIKRRKARKLTVTPFAVETVKPAEARARVFVVACWADEISSVMKGLQ